MELAACYNAIDFCKRVCAAVSTNYTLENHLKL